MVGEVEKLGTLSPVATLLSIDLAHSGSPLLHTSTVFIREPKNLWTREDEYAAEEVLGVPGTGIEAFGHTVGYVSWGRRVEGRRQP